MSIIEPYVKRSNTFAKRKENLNSNAGEVSHKIKTKRLRSPLEFHSPQPGSDFGKALGICNALSHIDSSVVWTPCWSVRSRSHSHRASHRIVYAKGLSRGSIQSAIALNCESTRANSSSFAHSRPLAQCAGNQINGFRAQLLLILINMILCSIATVKKSVRAQVAQQA